MMSGASDTAPDHTVDAFHRGAFHLVQPSRKGHRAGTDAMMLAASVPSRFSGRLADLGAGAGAAGLAVASRCGKSRVTLLERSPDMVGFARFSLQHPLNEHLADRCDVLETDVRLDDRTRRTILGDNSFDWAIMNPPFNSGLDHASPDALRREAHVMEDGEVFFDWLKTAGWLVRPAGGVSVIARPISLPAILAAMRPYFGKYEVKALHPRVEKAAIRIVVRARRGAAEELSIAPPLVLHDPGSDRLSAAADDISNGRASLFGD